MTLSEDGIVEMYADFAETYDETVLGEYQYSAHKVVGAWIMQALGLQESASEPSGEQSDEKKETVPVLLDLGCGTGLSSSLFFKLRPTPAVTGIDVTQAMLDKANRYPYSKLICQSLESPSLSVPDSHFDGCVMLGVLEFIRDPEQLFRRVHTKLKPNGVFGLTIPNKIAAKYERTFGIKTYSTEAVEAELKAAGFAIEERKEILGYKLSSPGAAPVLVNYVALLARKCVTDRKSVV